jgi:hypothetical protein
MILNWKDFNEANGIEWLGPVGPGWPETSTPNTLDDGDTGIKMCDIDQQLYTYDDYQNKYQEYLKHGGTPLHGFSVDNLNTVILNLSEGS